MNLVKHTRVFLYLITCLFCSSTIVAGEGHHHFSGDPVKAMAEIVVGLKHFPSRSERGQLNDIAAHSNDPNIVAIAKALLNMRHSVNADDKATLAKIASDKNLNSNVRELATIVSNISHKPSRDDKQKLAVITGH